MGAPTPRAQQGSPEHNLCLAFCWRSAGVLLRLWRSGVLDLATLEAGKLPRLPKTIDFTVDYLRSGLPRDAYARARVARSGRRYASVNVEAWQDKRTRLFTQATGHFLMPDKA